MYRPDLQAFTELAGRGNLVPVCREILADLETPVSAFMKISGGEDYSFLLESVEGGEKLARYSFLGTSPRLVFQCRGSRASITESGVTREFELQEGENALGVLKGLLQGYDFVPCEDMPPFCGGAVGYLGYDAVRRFEDLPAKPADALAFPDISFMIAETILVFDHVAHKIKIIANALVKDDPEAAYNEACLHIDAMVDRLRRPLPDSAAPDVSEGRLSSDFAREDFCRAVERIGAYIAAGDVIQTVISRCTEVDSQADPLDVYRALRSLNPSPYMYYLNFAGLRIIGSSPEILVTENDGLVRTRPIAGTRRRGVNEAEDRLLEAELLGDEKERAEHIMLVDLGRNDLGRVCRPGSVQVSELMVVERYSHVMHIVSNISGALREGLDRFDALQACFPAGTVTGAPKVRAMEIIDELEPSARGPYAGAVGYFGFSGSMDTCITIRTIIHSGGKYYLQSGAGIVADSSPDAEYKETVSKAEAMMAAIRMAERGLF